MFCSFEFELSQSKTDLDSIFFVFCIFKIFIQYGCFSIYIYTYIYIYIFTEYIKVTAFQTSPVERQVETIAGFRQKLELKNQNRQYDRFQNSMNKIKVSV